MRNVSPFVLLVLAACSGTPTVIYVLGADAGDVAADAGTNEAGDDDAGDGGSDSADADGGDAAADAEGGLDPVFGSSTFAYVNPGQNANTANAAHQNTVEGKNCVVAGCHLDGNQPFKFAGTVYTTANGNQTVAEAEVRIVSPSGVEVGRSYTDANGNFWLSAGGTIPASSRVGARTALSRHLMIDTISGLDSPSARECSNASCHGDGMRVFVP